MRILHKLEDFCETDNSRFYKRMLQVKSYFATYTEHGNDEKFDWKICLSDTAVHHAVIFFHILLNHLSL